jgi:sterol desaturase/sphingolipid hydroxylase (fatty acid hydroxylase superfamily)
MADQKQLLVPALRWTAFPVFAFVLPAAGAVLLRAGAGATVASLVPLLVAVALVALLERVIPYDPAWNRPRGDVGLDLTYVVLTLGVAALTQSLVIDAAAAARPIGLAFWPAGWPLPLQVGLALLVSDLGLYLFHRASHASDGLLWRIHSVHHSAERMYWLNGGRFHPANVFFNVALKASPLALLGATAEAILVAGLVSGIQSFVSHANLDLHAGPLNQVFSTPEVHRWHHARDLRDANANYGGTLMVWDLLFGTWSLPARRLGTSAVGLQDAGTYPTRLNAQLLYPLPARRSGASCGWSWIRCCGAAR